MFYDLYIELCEKKNVTPTRAAVEMGISKATPTTWKKRGLTPQGETLNKIANYFGVSTDYLFGIEKTPVQKDGGKGAHLMNGNLAYREERREERINGKVVAMSPRPSFNHNRIAENIDFIFRTYLKGKKCVPLGDGYDLYLSEEDHFIPDFMVVCDRDKIKLDGVHGAPDLVVEVLSPRTMKNDKSYKKDAYAKYGVREYWIVSPDGEFVEVYLLDEGCFVLKDVYTFQPWTKEILTEEERTAVVTKFKCSLYDDLEISLSEVFGGLLP